MKIVVIRPNKQLLAQTPASDFVGKALKKAKEARVSRQSSRAPKKAARLEKRAVRRMSRRERGSFFQRLKNDTVLFWNTRKAKIQAKRAAKGKKPILKKNRNQRPLVVAEGSDPNQPLVFQDMLPTVESRGGVLIQKTPDGKEVVLPPNTELVTVTTPAGEPIKIDKSDVNRRPIQYDQDDNPFVSYSEEEVDEYIGPSGQPELVRPEVDEQKGWKSLKKWQKGLIIGGTITGIALIGYAIYKATQKGDK